MSKDVICNICKKTIMKYDSKNDDWDSKTNDWFHFSSTSKVIIEDVGGDQFGYSFKELGLKEDTYLDFCSHKCCTKWTNELVKNITIR